MYQHSIDISSQQSANDDLLNHKGYEIITRELVTEIENSEEPSLLNDNRIDP